MNELTDFQHSVARAFFSLDVSGEFVLSGGAALISHDLISRSTGDLDLFGIVAERIDDVVAAFVAEASARGWPVDVVRQSSTFARIEVGDMEADGIVIDLGVDSAPLLELADA